MAKDIANGVEYVLHLHVSDKDFLAAIRHFSNLKIGFEDENIWVKDLTEAQVKSTEVKSIPFKNIFYLKENKLYPQGKLLPYGNMPSLLWTPIERGLPVTLPAFNHNYFGIDDKLNIRIIPSTKEKVGTILLTTIEILENYIETAPAIRLKKLTWVLLDEYKVMLFGTPLLPIQGEVYWINGNFVLPAGYDLALYSITGLLDKKINPAGNNYVIWNTDSSYFLLDKLMIAPLSLSSFRKSIHSVNQLN
jgi:hypothetical protein